MSHCFGSIFVVETRQSSASLEPMTDVLAYVEPELWLAKEHFLQNLKN